MASQFEFEGDFPKALVLGGLRYVQARHETFFWDEFRDRDGRTVGFCIPHPGIAKRESVGSLIECQNVAVDGDDLSIMLQSCESPELHSVQGFGAQIYVCATHAGDCLILMFNYSGNEIAFALRPIDCKVE